MRELLKLVLMSTQESSSNLDNIYDKLDAYIRALDH